MIFIKHQVRHSQLWVKPRNDTIYTRTFKSKICLSVTLKPSMKVMFRAIPYQTLVLICTKSMDKHLGQTIKAQRAPLSMTSLKMRSIRSVKDLGLETTKNLSHSRRHKCQILLNICGTKRKETQ